MEIIISQNHYFLALISQLKPEILKAVTIVFLISLASGCSHLYACRKLYRNLDRSNINES